MLLVMRLLILFGQGVSRPTYPTRTALCTGSGHRNPTARLRLALAGDIWSQEPRGVAPQNIRLVSITEEVEALHQVFL
jgi:hypothetical protein